MYTSFPSSSNMVTNGHSNITKGGSQTKTFLVILRSVMLDLPLALLFLTFLVIYAIRSIHKEYYQPLFDRAHRSDNDLNEEYTYYYRTCNEYDITARNVGDLLLNRSATLSETISQVQLHGSVVIPELLRPETVQKLRSYIVWRNDAVTDDEEYPVSQGENRISYGIDATEHPAVTQAIREVTNNPTFRSILMSLLGDHDPSSAEITAITAYAGCPPQVWHMDTKSEGNALKFARTYSHSYSLFMPLQDTTTAMGATDICPGTHYCSNDLETLCESRGMSIADIPNQGYFRAGDAALLNQHVWHRGAAHTDPQASERIVFIMSFLARPNPNDPRQLSRGTYFHMKWNMWGHTLRDLMNPLMSMQKPYSILRCLGLWKPRGYNWGYDLMTSGFMRFANEQLEYEDLSGRFLPRLDQLGFPKWLRGTVLDSYEYGQKQSWEVFIKETLDKTYSFMTTLTTVVHCIYLFVLIAAALTFSSNKLPLVTRATMRLLLTHGILLVITYEALNAVRRSNWGHRIVSGKMLMRPFPPVTIQRSDADALVTDGITTLPSRYDVLVGTRFDAKFLGSYDNWLDYHPGNYIFHKTVSKAAPLYAKRDNLNSDLVKQIESHVERVVTTMGGRFLQQDWRNGDWRIMSHPESLETIQLALAQANSSVLSALIKEIDWMVAEYRFGDVRGTCMARLSQIHLLQLKRRMSLGSPRRLPTIPLGIPKHSWALSPRTYVHFVNATITVVPALEQRFTMPSSREFQEGTLVWVSFALDGNWYPGTILAVGPDETYFVSYDDGTWEMDVDADKVHKRETVQEGDMIVSCSDGVDDDCMEGEVIRVMPSGEIAVYLEDDEFGQDETEWRLPPSEYYVPPYRYPYPTDD